MEVRPAPSVTVQITTVVPSGKTEGASLVNALEGRVQLSLKVGVPRVTPDAVQELASADTVTEEGHSIVGFWLSMTVTS